MNDNAKERICKNCKYHYIEEISFDYPQSCCSKRQITTEELLKFNDFEYDDRYIEQLQQENQELKKQLEEKENNACNWKGSCLENAGKIEKLETQQKEFIEWLENENRKIYRDFGLRQKIFKQVLQKYKEITGDDK